MFVFFRCVLLCCQDNGGCPACRAGPVQLSVRNNGIIVKGILFLCVLKVHYNNGRSENRRARTRSEDVLRVL
jgi:hypothetical protein